METLMKRAILSAVVWMLLGSGAPARSAEVTLNGRHFALPDGFELDVIAGPPLVDRPISADFDEQGRLYVSDSSGSNDNVRKQLEEKPHRILRLEDTDGDGRFDTRVIYADRMMFPEGVLWHDGSLYVAAPPSIWKLTDTDGDGVADRREEWFQGKTLTGCANDLHGPYLGPDGWIYWCKGAWAEQTYERPGGKPPFVTRAAHIFRRRPEGGFVEPVMTGGMDNPVEVVFTPGGERIFTTTFLQHPAGGQRDGLIHAVYGGVYGKPRDDLERYPRTGDLMPILTHLGAAAPCGFARLESDEFGAEFKDNLVTALFNMHKVTRHILEPAGATFRSRDEDFLVCDDLDFHPTDLIEDADGSLIVVDTGGWYKLCCPTSQLWKPDLLGAIYRVRRTGAHRIADARGLKLDWSRPSARELAERLADGRVAVRKRAAAALADRGREAVTAIVAVGRKAHSARTRRAATWALSRLTVPEARKAGRTFLTDADEHVRQAAIHTASVWRDRGAVSQLTQLLTSPSLHNRRAAAEALGRIGDRSAVAPLLAAASMPHDRVLEHSLIFALIEIADPIGTRAGLDGASPSTRRAALIALDQMEGGDLRPEDVTVLMTSGDRVLRESAAWIVNRHPAWGPALEDVLRVRLAQAHLSPSGHETLQRQLVRFSHHGSIQAMMAAGLRDDAIAGDTKRTILRAMAGSGLKSMPAVFATQLARLLAHPDAQLIRETVAAARALPGRDALEAELNRVGRTESLPDDVRLEALAALPNGLASVDPAIFDFLLSHLPTHIPVRDRTLAADVLARANMTVEQLDVLTDALPTVGPMELERVLGAFARFHDERTVGRLVQILRQVPSASALNQDTLKKQFAKAGESVRAQIAELCTDLTAQNERRKDKFEALLATLDKGDVRRGQLVFNSPKAACSSCHAIGYLGGTVGPDLTRIARIRSRRDLLEAILFPSASFVRSYEPVAVITVQGQSYNGVLRKDTHAEIVLATNAEEEIRIPREDIEQLQTGTVSIMPAGMDEQLTRQELSDLLTFLEAAR